MAAGALAFAAEVEDFTTKPWAKYVMTVGLEWIEAHCVIPDGFSAGEPYELVEWQVWALANHYRVKPDATLTTLPSGLVVPSGATAFHYRRSQWILSQKAGKGPGAGAWLCLESLGPALFNGWAQGGEVYRCSENHCPCGWTYEYMPGEPMGARWPTPLLQVTAFSDDQTANVYDALRPMILKGPLADVEGLKVGEDFIRLPGAPTGGRIDTVTSSAQSRLGQRVTGVLQDEVQLWTETNKMVRVADTQRRGAAGMQGRVLETSNAWDPSENSVAQRTATAALKAKDIFRLHPQGDPGLRYADKRQRRLIHQHVYAGSWWINVDAIEGEASELIETDPAQAERFYGNRIVAGAGAWCPDELWAKHSHPEILVPEGAEVTLGFDGSESDDWTAIRLQTEDGHRFTPHYGPDRRPTYWNPKEWGGSIPRSEVHAAVDELARRYRIRRAYCDPRDWESEIGDWAQKFGEEVFLEWHTYRPIDMHKALVQAITDLRSGRSTHDGDPVAALHVSHARKIAKPSDRYIIGKPDQHRKIDICMADVLAHRAACDLRAEGWTQKVHKPLTRVKARGRTASRPADQQTEGVNPWFPRT